MSKRRIRGLQIALASILAAVLSMQRPGSDPAPAAPEPETPAPAAPPWGQTGERVPIHIRLTHSSGAAPAAPEDMPVSPVCHWFEVSGPMMQSFMVLHAMEGNTPEEHLTIAFVRDYAGYLTPPGALRRALDWAGARPATAAAALADASPWAAYAALELEWRWNLEEEGELQAEAPFGKEHWWREALPRRELWDDTLAASLSRTDNPRLSLLLDMLRDRSDALPPERARKLLLDDDAPLQARISMADLWCTGKIPLALDPSERAALRISAARADDDHLAIDLAAVGAQQAWRAGDPAEVSEWLEMLEDRAARCEATHKRTSAGEPEPLCLAATIRAYRAEVSAALDLPLERWQDALQSAALDCHRDPSVGPLRRSIESDGIWADQWRFDREDPMLRCIEQRTDGPEPPPDTEIHLFLDF